MRNAPLALITAALLAHHASAGESPERARLLERAGAALALQPGDADAFATGLDHPVEFTQIAGNQEFSGQLHVRAKTGHTEHALARVMPLLDQRSPFVEEYVVRIPNGMDEESLASMLIATGDYEFVQPNWTLYPVSNIPNDPQYGSSWQHTRIQSAAAWDITTGDSSVIVAICDTGVDLDHPDLEAALVSGYNAWTHDAQIDGGDVTPVGGHGTFVSGCAAAIGNNSTGVVGAGWNFRIMPVRVVSTNGSASSFSISDGARWAGEHGAKVVNVSFTGATTSGNVQLARDLKANGALLFYAAGNDNAQTSPARPDFVIVASTTSSDTKSSFSNWGSAISISAPGSNVRSTQNGGGYGNGSGTSYASPIAAGVGAMIFSVNPELGPDDVQEILYATVDDLGAPGRDDFFGLGRVNTFSAVTYAQTYTPRVMIPITESFETTDWSDLLFAASGSIETFTDPSAPDGSAVLVMDATDTVESVLLGGRPAITGGYSISARIKATGVEAGESLDLQFKDSAGSWNTIISMPSFGIDTDGYTLLDAPLPNTFGYHGVSIRIVANGSDSSDQWMIDDLRIQPTAEQVLPFTDSFDAGTLSALRWDASTTASAGALGASIGMELDGQQTAETVDIDLTPLANDAAYINFFAASLGGTDDTLLVQYRDFFGNWATIDTITTAQLSAIPSGFSYQVPFLGLVDDFRLRLTDGTNTGGFFIDDLEIGADPLVLGCGPADFTGDGSLDIFDVFAFLDAFNTANPAADFTADGSFDIFDVFAYLDLFNAGCP
ncbi:MAG: S8 family serine peptidase [Phycisphaerales bacterium]|nr:S8 family serine peptidase [Phycisphaerales bacterium]